MTRAERRALEQRLVDVGLIKRCPVCGRVSNHCLLQSSADKPKFTLVWYHTEASPRTHYPDGTVDHLAIALAVAENKACTGGVWENEKEFDVWVTQQLLEATDG